MENVKNYASRNDLESLTELLQKGALAGQNPAEIDSIHELTEEDREVLREEVTRRWKQPWALYYTIVLNSIAAAIQGWDQTGIYEHKYCFHQTSLTI